MKEIPEDVMLTADRIYNELKKGPISLSVIAQAIMEARLEGRNAVDNIWRENMRAQIAAMRMVRDAIGELFGPLADLPSEEGVLLNGPEPHHEAYAIIAAAQRVAATLTAMKSGK